MCKCEYCKAKRKKRMKAAGLTMSILTTAYFVIRRKKK